MVAGIHSIPAEAKALPHERAIGSCDSLPSAALIDFPRR